MFEISKEEKAIITKQLGRKAANLQGIVSYCPFDKPAVLLTSPYSLESGVFPTIYWLSCPNLVKQVDRLEDQGLIKKISKKVKLDKDLQKKMEKVHYEYAQKRMSLLAEKERAKLKKINPNILKVLQETGIGGIKNYLGVKCLHTHLADFLVTKKNPLGCIVYSKVKWPQNCQICQEVIE